MGVFIILFIILILFIATWGLYYTNRDGFNLNTSKTSCVGDNCNFYITGLNAIDTNTSYCFSFDDANVITIGNKKYPVLVDPSVKPPTAVICDDSPIYLFSYSTTITGTKLSLWFKGAKCDDGTPQAEQLVSGKALTPKNNITVLVDNCLFTTPAAQQGVTPNFQIVGLENLPFNVPYNFTYKVVNLIDNAGGEYTKVQHLLTDTKGGAIILNEQSVILDTQNEYIKTTSGINSFNAFVTPVRGVTALAVYLPAGISFNYIDASEIDVKTIKTPVINCATTRPPLVTTRPPPSVQVAAQVAAAPVARANPAPAQVAPAAPTVRANPAPAPVARR
jgi:hypothetical protein